MAKTASVTVRIPESLKRQIEAKAALEHRSLSAQVEHELTEAMRSAAAPGLAKAGKLLGRFADRKVPSREDFRLARQQLWTRLDPDRA
jgi:hypothetical protein